MAQTLPPQRNLAVFIDFENLALGFQDAVLRGDWGKTFRVGHPGVLTTWLGTLSIPQGNADVGSRALATCQITDDAQRLNEAGETSKQVSERLREVGALLFAGRVGIAIFTWVSVILIFFLARVLWGVEIGLASLVLVGLSPFYLAHSRFLHVDAVLTGVMTISVLSLLAAVVRSPSGRVGFVVLSGAAGGLAALQKSPAMFLAPLAGLVLLINALRRGINRERALLVGRDLALWGAAAGIAYAATWPAMWVAPIETIQKVLGKAVGYAEEGHTLGNYFMGRPMLDPGWAFYPTAILFRLSPLSLVGLLASVGWWACSKKQDHERIGFAVLLLYTALFGAFMSLGAKKFDRYILPVFPALEIAASFGLVWLLRIARARMDGQRGTWVTALGAVAAIAFSLALALPHQPHYLTYYNPLLGGTRRAHDVLLLGWGEGYEEIVPYLNAKPNAQNLQVAVSRFSGFAPVFRGEPRSMRTYTSWETDYVVIYVGQVQRRRYEWILEEYHYNPDAEPEHVVTMHGVDYAWIYPNEHYVEPIEYLERHAQPDAGDCLLVNGNSLLAKHYQGALPAFAFEGHWNPAEEAHFYWDTRQLADLLDEAKQACRQVWYARYPEYESNSYLRLLESRGLLVGQASFPHVELLHYQMMEPSIDETRDLQFEALRLSGWGTTDPPPAWGRDGGIFMAWEAVDHLDEDYSVFLHLYDSQGQRVSQGDSLLVDQALEPTSQWDPGVQQVALYHLPIPPGTPPGRYELDVGVYQLESGSRLPLVTEDGEPRKNSRRLQVEIGIPDQPVPLDQLDISHLTMQDLRCGLRVVGYDVDELATLTGRDLGVRVTWQVIDAPEEDYRLRIALRSEGGASYSSFVTGLVGTDYPTSEWHPGEVLQEWYYVPVGDEVPTGEVTLTLNLVREGGEPVSNTVLLGDVWVQSMAPAFDLPAQVGETSAARLGDKIALLGYAVAPSARAGAHLPLTVYWMAKQAMAESYKVFVHLYDREGSIVAQLDRVPGLGARPTNTWKEGEVVADRLLVPVDADATAGVYQIAIGLYDPQTGTRLPTYRTTGERCEDDRIALGRVEIDP